MNLNIERFPWVERMHNSRKLGCHRYNKKPVHQGECGEPVSLYHRVPHQGSWVIRRTRSEKRWEPRSHLCGLALLLGDLESLKVPLLQLWFEMCPQWYIVNLPTAFFRRLNCNFNNPSFSSYHSSCSAPGLIKLLGVFKGLPIKDPFYVHSRNSGNYCLIWGAGVGAAIC